MQVLKTEIDRLTREQAECDGATKQELLRLKELGFDSVEEAVTGVQSLNSERAKLERDRDARLKAYLSERDARFSEKGTK